MAQQMERTTRQQETRQERAAVGLRQRHTSPRRTLASDGIRRLLPPMAQSTAPHLPNRTLERLARGEGAWPIGPAQDQVGHGPALEQSTSVDLSPREAVEAEPSDQALRRRVAVDVTMQTITEEAVQQMTIVELRQQVALLEQSVALSEARETNMALLTAELARREAEIEAATLEEVDRQCNRELDRLQRWMLSPGGLALQTLRAYDGAVGNFLEYAGVSSAGGVQFSDVFGIVLALVPGVGPVARWIGTEALRAATVAAAQAMAGAVVQRGASMGAETSSATEERARADFAAQVRAESAALADSLARNVDGVVTTFENAVDMAHRSRNVLALRMILIHIQHTNDEARAVELARFAELGRRFEIELYRRHYRDSGRLIEHIAPYTSQRLRYKVEGIPSPVLDRVLGRGGLNAAENEEQLARDWGFPRRIEMDLPRGGRGR